MGPAWIASSGVFYGKPDMSNDAEIFKSEHGRPFIKLLTFAEDYEAISAQDREIYREIICYLGGVYKGIVEGTDESLATCRRLMALPSRNDPRFIDMVEANQPRVSISMIYITVPLSSMLLAFSEFLFCASYRRTSSERSQNIGQLGDCGNLSVS